MQPQRARRGLIGLAAMCLAGFAGGAAAGPQTRNGATRQQAAVSAVCGSCHNLEMVDSAPRSYPAWIDTVQAMVDRGATGTDEQFADVLDYLHHTATTINVNAAASRELTIVLDVPESIARAIASRRASRPFEDLADLKTVRGIDAAALDRKARLIFFR